MGLPSLPDLLGGDPGAAKALALSIRELRKQF